MSKTGAWVLNMQEDAANLTKDEFLKKCNQNLKKCKQSLMMLFQE